MMLTQAQEAERQELPSFHLFINDHDLGTAENTAQRKECWERRTESRRMQGSASKALSPRTTEEEGGLTGRQKVWVAVLTWPEATASLWASVSTFIYSFIRANYVLNTVGGAVLTEINRAVSAFHGLVTGDR